MKIKGFEEERLSEYPGKLSSLIGFYGCNFRCPACHARRFVLDSSEEHVEIEKREILDYLERMKDKKWIDAVVFGGAEPPLQPIEELKQLAKEIKDLGYLVGIETNGSNPGVLRELLPLFDYVALDIKAPYYLYPKVVGRDVDMDRIEESIKLTTKFPDYEFRTTIVPVLRNEEKGEFSWMTVQEGKSMARWVSEYVGRESKWYLQKFVPRERELIDERLENWQETPQQLLEEMLGIVKGYFPNVQIRGEN